LNKGIVLRPKRAKAYFSILSMLMPFQGVSLQNRYTHGVALGYELYGFQPIMLNQKLEFHYKIPDYHIL